ncbi:hypothetical protein OAF37_00335 [Rubripirellula sp.]|nr:hypothetical protein [Rubripirellula sp.]MDB4644479.1 hypothetical protein [Rubripirellula sp.]
MLDQIKDPPWEHDDKVVLEEKWCAANARAEECEKLRNEFSLTPKEQSSRKVQKLEAIEKTMTSVRQVAVTAAKGLYPTGLLADDFQWFVEQQTYKLPEILNQIHEEIYSIPDCPQFLFKEYTIESKVLITLIESKRWGKLLPLFEKQADCLARLSRGFADTLQQTLNERSNPSAPENQSCEELPESPDEWEEAAKKPIRYKNQEVMIRPQQRLLLTRLFFAKSDWLSAGDLACVEHGQADYSATARTISKALSKLEKQLGDQLEINYESGKRNKTDRPIQRRSGTASGTEYRLNPSLLQKLRRRPII